MLRRIFLQSVAALFGSAFMPKVEADSQHHVVKKLDDVANSGYHTTTREDIRRSLEYAIECIKRDQLGI